MSSLTFGSRGRKGAFTEWGRETPYCVVVYGKKCGCSSVGFLQLGSSRTGIVSSALWGPKTNLLQGNKTEWGRGRNPVEKFFSPPFVP